MSDQDQEAFVEPNGEESMKTISAGCDVLVYDDAANPVVAMQVFAFYDPTKGGSLGSLFWCERGRREYDNNRTLILDEVRDVYVGKHTVAFQSEAASSSYEDHCFSLCGGRFTLNVEVKTPDELEVWMAAVKFILTSSGRIVKDEDTVDTATTSVPNDGGIVNDTTAASVPNNDTQTIVASPPLPSSSSSSVATTVSSVASTVSTAASTPVATVASSSHSNSNSNSSSTVSVPASVSGSSSSTTSSTSSSSSSSSSSVSSGGNNRSRGQSLAQQIAAVQHSGPKHLGSDEKKIVSILGSPRVALPLEALLDKMSPAVLRGWQPRWFVLSDEGISYYKSALDFKNGAWPTGVVPIRHIEKVDKLSGAGEFQICIPTSEGGPGRSRHLHVTTNDTNSSSSGHTNGISSSSSSQGTSSTIAPAAISVTGPVPSSSAGAGTPGRKKNMLIRSSSVDQRDIWCRAIEQAVAIHQEKRRLSFVRW